MSLSLMLARKSKFNGTAECKRFLQTMILRESLERLSQQERCIAGLEARLAEATIANQEARIANQQEVIMVNPEANIASQEPGMAEIRGRRGSSSSREFGEEEEEEEMESKVGGRRGSSSSREFPHEVVSCPFSDIQTLRQMQKEREAITETYAKKNTITITATNTNTDTNTSCIIHVQYHRSCQGGVWWRRGIFRVGSLRLKL